MRVIEVLEPGLFSTVQDLGREGFGPLGVSPSGAADAISLRLGNRLAGNAEGAAALEMTLLGGTFAFSEGADIALAGSDFGGTLDGKPGGRWACFEGKPEQGVRVGRAGSGAGAEWCAAAGVRGGMISEGVALAAVQVPEGGLPIILFVEQQTTGGYPKIANVISADFHSLGQLRPRDEIRFEQVDWKTARALLEGQEELMASKELIWQ